MLRPYSFLIAAMILVYPYSLAQDHSKAQRPAPSYGQPPPDLANALVQMARTSHVPLIAELVWPLPEIPTVEGVPLTPEKLNELLKKAPGYDWKMEGKTVHFYNKELRQARFNFLNCKFRQFMTPSNLSEMKLWFPGWPIGCLEGYPAVGGAISGFSDTMLEKEQLQRETLENVTALAALVYVANESPTFYTVLVFPSAMPTKRDAEQRVAWQWGSLNEKLGPIYTQPPARK
ncbi:MAG: hypothetical protein ACRD2U_00350 [Terriglobales bacterium]